MKVIYTFRLWLCRKAYDLPSRIRRVADRIADAVYEAASRIDPSPRPAPSAPLTASIAAQEFARVLAEGKGFGSFKIRKPHGWLRQARDEQRAENAEYSAKVDELAVIWPAHDVSRAEFEQMYPRQDATKLQEESKE